jgi:cbb3-type cytochrome oxidase maturation protein
MSVLYITMGFTVLLAGFFLYLFFKNVKTGQYDDVYTPSVRMLFDDELVSEKSVEEEKNPTKESETLNK